MSSHASALDQPALDTIYLSPPDVGPEERAALLRAFDSNWIAPLGPEVDAFETEFAAYVDMPAAAALSSGTAALHLALDILGVGPGDRVLVQSLTFAASANVVRYMGAEPVFVDSEATSGNLCPNHLEEAIRSLHAANQRPKAIIAVDLYGQPADYPALQRIADAYDLPIIEDAAEALGSTLNGARAGHFGTMSAFSFNGNKIITTSGGGMLVARRTEDAARARHLASQAKEKALHYEHCQLGYNYRLSNLLAALGRAQLAGLEAKVNARRDNHADYRRRLRDVEGIRVHEEREGVRANYWLTTLSIDPDRFGASAAQICHHMQAHRIEARPLWKPMHLQPLYRDCQRFGGAIAEELFQNGICLPSGSSLTPEARARIVETMLACPRRR